MSQSAYPAAEARVNGAPELRRYAELLLWGFTDGGARKHWTWIAKAPAAELVTWARMREAEDGWSAPPLRLEPAGAWQQAALLPDV